jgi:nitrile hydratase accessory protein
MSGESPLGLSGFPRDLEGPVFNEPWEARAFAMVLRLHERGLFTWTEWAAALAGEIRAAQASGSPDVGDTYYEHWLRALESIVASKGAASVNELTRLQCAWADAAGRTPHGSPIKLLPEDLKAPSPP